jgi:hypothetical protein
MLRKLPFLSNKIIEQCAVVSLNIMDGNKTETENLPLQYTLVYSN